MLAGVSVTGSSHGVRVAHGEELYAGTAYLRAYLVHIMNMSGEDIANYYQCVGVASGSHGARGAHGEELYASAVHLVHKKKHAW